MTTRRQFLISASALLAAARVARAGAITPPLTGKEGSKGLAKFEPASGCYIGAFIERDTHVVGNIPAFEELTKKKHASYFTYVGYGRPFPFNWVQKVARNGGAPHIAFEPNDGLGEVKDSTYLRAWARDAARAKVPIFLRWAAEMNGEWGRKRYSPGTSDYVAEYKAKWRLITQIMRAEAPNVAMVWTPFAEPTKNIPDFYPGDGWVDWVGINIYSVFVHNGDPKLPSADEDPVAFLRTIYDLYADRKPIHVSEYAATIWCKGTQHDTVDWAIQKASRFYNAIREEFPRVKSVNYFCLDTVQAGLANNNYSLLSDGRMLGTYRQLVADRHFLSQVAFDPTQWKGPIKAGTTLGQAGVILRPESNDDILEMHAAIAATITEPFLRGLKNGDVIKGDLDLWAQLPTEMEQRGIRGIIWQVDNRTVAITNSQPFRVIVPHERFIEGEHTAQIIVWGKDGNQTQSGSVTFTLE